MEKLTWRPAPGPPAGPAQRRSSELLAGQAGRQVPDGDHSARHAAGCRPAPPPRLGARWMSSTQRREPAGHLHSPPTPLSCAPPPWPTPSPPPPRRSHALRQPHAVPPCPGAPLPSSPSSKPSPERSQGPSPPHRPRPNRHRRRSPSTPTSLRPVPGRTKCFFELPVSLAIFPSLPFLLPSRVATSRNSTAPTAVELVADVLPVTLRPQLGVYHAHHVT